MLLLVRRSLEHAELAVQPGDGHVPWLDDPAWYHADAGGLSRLIASRSSLAATVAPSVRIVPATAVARARVSGVRAVLSASDRDSVVGVGPSCAAPMPSSATRPAQYGWSPPAWGLRHRAATLRCLLQTIVDGCQPRRPVTYRRINRRRARGSVYSSGGLALRLLYE